MDLNEIMKEIHQNAIDHGWWDGSRTFGEFIALCHSELSEALEEYRNGKERIYYGCKDNNDTKEMCDGDCADCEYGKPEGIAVELADCIIRILDYCGHKNIDIGKIIRIKHEYNKNRPYRHGGKII